MTSRKPRREYAYVAYRLDQSNPQNLGEFGIYHHRAGQSYHWDPKYKRLVNRIWLRGIGQGSRTWSECMAAVDRLLAEEEAS